MLDLYNKKYSRELLIKHIYQLNFIDILKTQKLDIYFIVDYILNNNYQLTEEEEKLTPNIIIRFQPHIDLHELCILLVTRQYNTYTHFD